MKLMHGKINTPVDKAKKPMLYSANLRCYLSSTKYGPRAIEASL